VTTPLSLRRALLLLNLSYRVGELVQVGAERVEETQDRVPTNAAAASLDLGDVGRMNIEPDGQAVLCQASAITQGLERSTEQNLILSGITHLSTFGQVELSSGITKIVPPRRCSGRGRGTESSSSRRIGSLPSRIGCLPRQSYLPEPPNKEEPMSTITRAVLMLLLTEDRSWKVEELVRETDDRLGTLDAIAELDRSGLANRINKRFVCASRAALQADEIARGGV